jgi:hypothetical protein
MCWAEPSISPGWRWPNSQEYRSRHRGRSEPEHGQHSRLGQLVQQCRWVNNGLGITAVISNTGGGNNNTITLTSAAGSAGQLAAVNSTGTSIYTTDSATTSMQASQSASRQKFNHAIECVRDVRGAWKQVAQEVNQGEPQTSLASANRPQLVQTTSDPDFDSAEVGHWTA